MSYVSLGLFFLHTVKSGKLENRWQLTAEERMCVLKQSFISVYCSAGVRSSGNKEAINPEWNLSKCNRMTL